MTYEPLAYASTSDEELTRRTVSKVLWRLIPLMCFLYLFNYLDRVNVSFAKLQMSTDLKFDDAIYGLGASIFFIGYFIFEVPSNLIMEKVGARLWMARIMVTWGVISVAMMFVKEPWHFYGLRLLLGIAEAGFFPGMILYMTYWIPAQQRARAAALFLTSTALSGVVGGPLADVLMQMDHYGLRGWQWLFLLEGIPSIILGVGILFLLTDRPQQASWLSYDEKRVLLARLGRDHSAMGHAKHSLAHALGDMRVWILCLLYGTVIFGFYVINYWTPSLIKITLAPGSKAPIGALSAIPFFTAAVTMSIAGWWADHTGRRRLTIILFALGGACGYAIAAMAHNPLMMIVGLSIAAGGIWSTLGPIWALPSRFLRGTAAAAGIGMINSFGNLIGGFIGPNMMGQIKERYGNYDAGLWVSAGVSVLAAVVAGVLVKERHEPADMPQPATLPAVPVVSEGA